PPPPPPSPAPSPLSLHDALPILVTQQILEIATLSTFTTYAVGIFEPIQMTAANIAEFISLQASIERVTGLLDQEPQVRDTPEVTESEEHTSELQSRFDLVCRLLL